MSDLAILSVVPAYIISKMPTTWTVDNCKAMPDGQPDPVAKSPFLAVHITEFQARQQPQEGLLEEVWGFGVTITKRITAVPYDRITGSVYLEQLVGLAPLVERVKFCLHNKWSLNIQLDAWTPTVPDTDLASFVDDSQFMTPAKILNRTPKITFHDEEWFHGTHGQPPRNARDGFTGVSMTLFFGGLLKVIRQSADSC